jgi:hypothetical protein
MASVDCRRRASFPAHLDFGKSALDAVPTNSKWVLIRVVLESDHTERAQTFLVVALGLLNSFCCVLDEVARIPRETAQKCGFCENRTVRSQIITVITRMRILPEFAGECGKMREMWEMAGGEGGLFEPEPTILSEKR